MLTKTESAWVVDRKRGAGHIKSDRITGRQPEYVTYARELLDYFKDGIGKTRRELEQGVAVILNPVEDCTLRRAKAFYKLLIDASEFDRDSGRSSYRLRKQLYQEGARFHPLRTTESGLWGHQESEARAEVTKALGKTWQKIESEAFCDVTEFHTLKKFNGYESPEHLLNRYNIAQAQVLVKLAYSMRVEATSQFKEILRYAKLAKLLHTIKRIDDGHYVFDFFGPASVVEGTKTYGVDMARFLPSLLRIEEGWKMDAVIQTDVGKERNFHLDPSDRLRPMGSNHEDEYDAQLEETFARKWGDEPRDGWTLKHEDEVLWRYQKTFVPDFSFTHTSGKRVLFEIAGYWTKEYAEAKRETLAAFPDEKILLAVPDGKSKNYDDLGFPILRYKSGIKIKELLEVLEKHF